MVVKAKFSMRQTPKFSNLTFERFLDRRDKKTDFVKFLSQLNLHSIVINERAEVVRTT